MKILKSVKIFTYSIIRVILRSIIDLIYRTKESMIAKDESTYRHLIDEKKYKNYNHTIYPTESDIKVVATSLSKGDITANTNYSGIQQLGVHLSPVGNDKPHTVVIKQCSRYSAHIIARIEVTNEIYSEWIVACCNTMWHSEHKMFKDINGNNFPVGKLLECIATIEYQS